MHGEHVTGIEDLPDNILANIFSLACDRQTFLEEVPVQTLIAGVSTRFRSVAYGSTELWANIDTTRVPEEEVSQWLQRSGSKPLTITLEAQRDSIKSGPPAFMQDLKKHTYRWQTLNIELDYNAHKLGFLSRMGGHTFSMLERIDFIYVPLHLKPLTLSTPTFFAGWNIPSKWTLHCNHVIIPPINAPNLSTSYQSLEAIVSLELNCRALTKFWNESNLPQLETLTLSLEMSFEIDEWADNTNYPPGLYEFHLPQLKSFTFIITSTYSIYISVAMCLLLAIRAPNLEKLSLGVHLLDSNLDDGAFFKDMPRFPNLKTFEYSFYKGPVVLPGPIYRFRALEHYTLRESKVDSNDPHPIPNPSRLKKLVVSQCKNMTEDYTRRIIQELKDIGSFECLKIDRCPGLSREFLQQLSADNPGKVDFTPHVPSPVSTPNAMELAIAQMLEEAEND